MEHSEAVRIRATEKYLLAELDPDTRDQFEEHLFECQECALDLRAASAFVEVSKTVLAEPESVPQRVSVPAKTSSGWLQWLRPAIAAPLLASLLVVIAVQNFYQGFGSRTGSDVPRVLPTVSLITANTRGGVTPSIRTGQGIPFLAFIDVPADSRYTSYSAQLRDASGKTLWSLPIPANLVHETLSLQIPSLNSGSYRIVMLGSTGDGETVELGQYPVNVDVQ